MNSRIRRARLLDLKTLQKPNPNFNMKIRPAEQDSYYDLVAAAEGYWRALNTNGTLIDFALGSSLRE